MILGLWGGGTRGNSDLCKRLVGTCTYVISLLGSGENYIVLRLGKRVG